MAGVEISNFGASSQIINKINEAKMLVEKCVTNVGNAQAIVPAEIKSSVSGKIQALLADIETIKTNCEHAAAGIKDNVDAYLAYEEAEGGFTNTNHIKSISGSNSFFWGYLSGTGTLPKRCDFPT